MKDRLQDRAHRLAEAWLHDPPDKALDIGVASIERRLRILHPLSAEPLIGDVGAPVGELDEALVSNVIRSIVPNEGDAATRFLSLS